MKLLILILGIFMANITLADEKELRTHNPLDNYDIKAIEERLIANEASLTLPLKEEITLLHQLEEFELGRFLLKNRGINGFWTAYWLIHGPKKKLEYPLENWLINESPSFTASQERFVIFQKEIQKRIKSNMKLVSIPCGLMNDLLSLDYKNVENVELIGIDLDKESLELAQKNTAPKNVKTAFYQKNAWNLNIENEYDLITSNGLNFYESDDKKVVELYKEFYHALKKGGILVTSFLTPMPTVTKDSSWKNYSLDKLKKQKAIFADILQGRWSATRSHELTKKQLEEAGFKVLYFIDDKKNAFPTVVAEK